MEHKFKDHSEKTFKIDSTYSYAPLDPFDGIGMYWEQPSLRKRIYWKITDFIKSLFLYLSLGLCISLMIHQDKVIELILYILNNN